MPLLTPKVFGLLSAIRNLIPSLMSTSVGDPFLLSSYSLPHKLGPYVNSSTLKLANIYATHQNGLGSEGHVLAAAQGDGLHILDLSTLHPVISHTLGPSTVFSCPAISRISSTPEGSHSAVYAVMENVQGIKTDERGRTVRVWIDNASGEGSSSSVQQRMYSSVLPHRVSSIAVNDELSNSVLFIGGGGEVTITDSEVNVQHTYSPSDTSTRLIWSFVFCRRSCSFVPTRSGFKQGAVVVLLVKAGPQVHLTMLGAEPSKITALGECPIPTAEVDIAGVSCSESGFVSILWDWYALQIDSLDHAKITLLKPSLTICLRNLSFVANAGIATPLDELSLLSLGSSHVLLAGVTGAASPELVLLLWDLQYGVLLASRSLTIPSSVTRHKKHGINIQLVAASGAAKQAFLVLSANPATGMANDLPQGHENRPSNDVTQRSSILVIPYTVPATSTVANALGRAAASEKWLTTKSVAVKPSVTTLNADQAKCIRVMRTSMDQKRVEAVDETYLNWAAHAHAESEGATASSRPGAPRVPYGYEFVKQVLDIVLRPPKGPGVDPSYSPKVVRHLLDRRCISSNMVSGGLLPALRLRKDWASMILAVKTVNDIPEDHLVSLLSTSATTARQREKQPLTDDSAMEVDSGVDSSLPSLSSVLPLCVTYPTSAPALRLALRRHFSDAEALTSVLGLLAEWLRSYAEEEPQLFPEGTKKDLHGALVPLYEEQRKRKHRHPPAEKVCTLLGCTQPFADCLQILSFVQTILDSSFLSLLSYPPSYDILRRIFSYIEPEATFTDDLELLRGPLEPFVNAHSKMVHEAAHGPEKPDLTGDWRKKRKEAHEQAAIAVGVYQVEELVF
ncbi:hypothetical protein BC835DRAFT_264850 [Cytidiella melzeri]|nr:hypothetical protein BC835DRAFT_264850 [Cytidiella melzeri]